MPLLTIRCDVNHLPVAPCEGDVSAGVVPVAENPAPMSKAHVCWPDATVRGIASSDIRAQVLGGQRVAGGDEIGGCAFEDDPAAVAYLSANTPKEPLTATNQVRRKNLPNAVVRH